MVAVSRSGQVTPQSDLAPTECAAAYERMVTILGREAPATPQQIRCDLWLALHWDHSTLLISTLLMGAVIAKTTLSDS